MKKLLAVVGATAVGVLAVPAAASAHTAQTECQVVHDHIAKTDNGHGTPSAWADLSLNRTTRLCGSEEAGYKVLLVDRGTLQTRPGAGTPNGTGGQIADRVPGSVYGVYHLTVSGGTPAHDHGNTSASSTEYVKSLFSDGATVTGGDYAWAYKTKCGEHWLDSSKNNDGQGAAAGNITGKTCGKPSHSPTPTPTAPGGDSGSTPTTMPSGAPQTGDGSAGGGSNTALMAAGGLVVVLGAGGGLMLWRRRSQN
jgi:hypothetical protein